MSDSPSANISKHQFIIVNIPTLVNDFIADGPPANNFHIHILSFSFIDSCPPATTNYIAEKYPDFLSKDD